MSGISKKIGDFESLGLDMNRPLVGGYKCVTCNNAQQGQSLLNVGTKNINKVFSSMNGKSYHVSNISFSYILYLQNAR